MISTAAGAAVYRLDWPVAPDHPVHLLRGGTADLSRVYAFWCSGNAAGVRLTGVPPLLISPDGGLPDPGGDHAVLPPY